MMPTLIAGTGLGILPESPAKICGTDPACEGCFSFGNGCQAIEVARASFGRFFQMLMKLLDNQADFDSAIPRFESWRPSQRQRVL